MMDFPANINLRGRTAVIVGGGTVATRRTRLLITCGARITVICRDASPQIQEWARAEQLRWIRRNWRPADCESAFLVIAATNSTAVNADVAAAANKSPLVCIAGDVAAGNCSVPAHIRRGRLTVTVSTGGASPLYAKKLCDAISGRLDRHIDTYLDFLFTIRQKILVACPEDRSLKIFLLKQLLQPEFFRPDRQAELLKHPAAWISEQKQRAKSVFETCPKSITERKRHIETQRSIRNGKGAVDNERPHQ
ncbi:MAG: siroheme synthase [Sporolactobacillus sp.]|jgi:precorrin-2 dehydrogenase/sirohydrochlorin ferrochelatase|nr:siroheme synthase [Sporolactobacillus sp.]